MVRDKAALILPSLAKSNDTDKLEELFADVEAGRCLYLEGRAAIVIAQWMADEGEGRSINIWIVGGDLEEVLSLTEGAEAVARGFDCRFASFSGGRKGWRRVMEPKGYAWTGDEFRKAL